MIPDHLAEVPFDVIVIGAGINGAGIARDAVMRGLKVLLVDKGDISAGTTSWSTRLIHGGLRYLEHREVGLVRESLKERERLLRIAPHLVRPLEFMIPIYADDKRGPRLVRLGMVAYDALSVDKSLDHHRMLSPQEALRREPGLTPDGLRGAAVYYDAQAEYPERLAVENALDARRRGAVVVPYAEVVELVREGNRVVGVTFNDALDGDGTRHTVRAPLVVNASGPWVDKVLRGSSDAEAARRIGGTKGSHIVVDRFPDAPSEALYVEADDGRPYFVVPWNGLFLIGTTDKRYEGDLDEVVADESEIEYLISETNQVIPGAGLTRDDVLYTYSGVRPLPHVQDGGEGGITRRHLIEDHAPELEGLLTIIGGKLTTYRSLAEQCVDKVLDKLGRDGVKCRTGKEALPGGAMGDLDAFREQFVPSSGLPVPAAERLVRIYGSRAVEVLDTVGDDPSLLEPLDPETGAIKAEVLFAFRVELAQNLADLMLRRTMVGMNSKVAVGADETAADVAVRHLNWDADRAQEEVGRYRAYITRMTPRSLRAVAA